MGTESFSGEIPEKMNVGAYGGAYSGAYGGIWRGIWQSIWQGIWHHYMPVYGTFVTPPSMV